MSFALLSGQNSYSATTLTWIPPTTNTDGSPLTDLSGYKLYYGTTSGSYSTTIDVGNVTTYTLTNLAYGTYYFSVMAYDTAGNHSVNSNEVPKTEADTSPPTITSLTMPSTSSSLTVFISSITATDNVGVTGYMITESATPPAAADAGWSATPLTSYTAASAGIHTLYAWVKDAAGNVSSSMSASVTITLAGSCSYGNVRIKRTSGYYPTIQAAYNASANGDTIQLHAGDFAESLTFQNNMKVTLQGGFGCDYSSNPGLTTISGKTIIDKGTIIPDMVVLQ